MGYKLLKGNRSSVQLIIITTIVVVDLLLLYYMKYDNQNLPLSFFRLAYIGNVFNAVCSLLIIAGLFIAFFVKGNMHLSSFALLSIIMTFFLVTAWIISKSHIHFPDTTILGQPINRIFISSLFFIFQFLQFVILIAVWIGLLNKQKALFFRSFIDALVLTLILLLFTFLYINFNQNYYEEKSKSNEGINVGVVLGAAVWTNEPSPSLAGRVDKAASLYKEKVIQKIQLTGGNAPGELSESEIAYRYIKTKNIDTNDVWIEKNTTSTTEQIHFINSNLKTRKNINKIIVISDSYHLARVRQIAAFYNLGIYVAASDLDLTFENNLYYKTRESAAILIFWFFAI
jgi:uncharacterized SAM-binding protein YcdF (DUF218 family)